MQAQAPTQDQLQLALLKAFTDKSDAEAKVKDAEAQIVALRNVLTGMQLAGAPAGPPPVPPTP